MHKPWVAYPKILDAVDVADTAHGADCACTIARGCQRAGRSQTSKYMLGLPSLTAQCGKKKDVIEKLLFYWNVMSF
ncbi:hypothetical protein CNY67_06380 [Desulfovibrio sp. G11]|nr:hypothetical protein CNY67_06380 [Desulfovibrio sp. G11]